MKTTSNLNLNKSTVQPKLSANNVAQGVIINVLPSGCRYETLEEIEYVVVPMVILTVGVHNGSNGPILYTEEELAKIPSIWDHKPLVVYHPVRNGEGISACSPTVLETRKVGMMLNTTFKEGKLKSEAWIRLDRVDKIDERIMEAIRNNEMMELSTGLFADHEDVQGTWNGEDYIAVARNFRPDHLALLPDQIGACSIRDGAGLLRNAVKADKKETVVAAFLNRLLKKAGLDENDSSHDEIYTGLMKQLTDRFNANADPENGPWLWIENVYDNFVIYMLGDKLFRLGYTVSDSQGVTLSDDTPVEVRHVSEYRTVEGATVVNQDQLKPKETRTTMDKNKTIDAILGNAAWKDTKREVLDAMSLDQLKSIHNGLKEPKGEGVDATPTAAPAAPVAEPATAPAKEGEAPTGNAEPKPRSFQDWLKTDVPAEFQELVSNGVKTMNEEKERLITTIVNQENSPFTAEELKSEPLDRLRKLAVYAAKKEAKVVAPRFDGQGEVIDNADGSEEALEMPAMSFEK